MQSMVLAEQIREFCFVDTNWFRAKYEKKLSEHSSRYWTFKGALNLFLQRGGSLIVETGCVRLENDYGAGNSTLILADFTEHYPSKLISVDNNATNAKLSESLVKRLHPSAKAELVVSDSVSYLASLAESGTKIDLLYLDSYDYPYGELLDIYGGKADLSKAIEVIKSIPLTELVARHEPLIGPCQEHCLKEIQAAMPALHAKSVVLIDDNLPGGGKGRLAREFLLDKGWECILDDYQSLWVQK